MEKDTLLGTLYLTAGGLLRLVAPNEIKERPATLTVIPDLFVEPGLGVVVIDDHVVTVPLGWPTGVHVAARVECSEEDTVVRLIEPLCPQCLGEGAVQAQQCPRCLGTGSATYRNAIPGNGTPFPPAELDPTQPPDEGDVREDEEEDDSDILGDVAPPPPTSNPFLLGSDDDEDL